MQTSLLVRILLLNVHKCVPRNDWLLHFILKPLVETLINQLEKIMDTNAITT